MGHTKIPFCLQSCVKPLTYAISISTLGTEYVHKFVGKEPSGLRYNKLSLNEEGEYYHGSDQTPRCPPFLFPPIPEALFVSLTLLISSVISSSPAKKFFLSSLQSGKAVKEAFSAANKTLGGLYFPRNPP